MASRRIFDIMNQQSNRGQIPQRGILNPVDQQVGANCFLHTGLLSLAMDRVCFQTITAMTAQDLPPNNLPMANRLFVLQDALLQLDDASQLPAHIAHPTDINDLVQQFLLNQQPPNDGGNAIDFFSGIRRGLDVPEVNRCGIFKC